MLLLYVYYMSLVIRLSFYFIPHRRSVRYYRSFGSKERKNLVSHLFFSLSFSLVFLLLLPFFLSCASYDSYIPFFCFFLPSLVVHLVFCVVICCNDLLFFDWFLLASSFAAPFGWPWLLSRYSTCVRSSANQFPDILAFLHHPLWKRTLPHNFSFPFHHPPNSWIDSHFLLIKKKKTKLFLNLLAAKSEYFTSTITEWSSVQMARRLGLTFFAIRLSNGRPKENEEKMFLHKFLDQTNCALQQSKTR